MKIEPGADPGLNTVSKLIIGVLTMLLGTNVLAATFSDTFSNVSYGNQDGTNLWSSDWVETGDDGSASSGDIQITGGELRLQNKKIDIARTIDLLGFTSAVLSFDYREVGFDGNSDKITVEIRSGGSGPWTNLLTFQGSVGSGSASQAIPAGNHAANTELRIVTGNKITGDDQFFVDNFTITATLTAAGPLDHFDISLSSGTFGLNCVPHQLRVTAHDSVHITVTSHVGEIQLATSTGAGDWTDGGLGNIGSLANAVAGDGVATYQYAAADLGQADFFLDYTNGTDNLVGININDTTDLSIVDDSLQTIQFSPSGFTLTQNSLSNPPPNPISDPLATQVAGTNFTVYLAAYGQTPTDSNCGIIEAYTGDHELHFWVAYDDPATGTLTPAVDGQSALDQECVLVGAPKCATGPNRQTVTFLNGQASVTVKYKDTGSITLNVKDDDNEVSQAVTIRGASGLFVVQPGGFFITTIETVAAVANPGTTNAGSGFVAAGEAFHLVVEVRDTEGSLVPNYGNEIVPETLRLLPVGLVYPAAGSLGSLTNATIFTPTGTSGEFENSTVSWTEVGTLTLRAGIGDSNFLGTGDVTGTVSGNVGRFYPADFELVSSSVTDSCASGSFSYLSQPSIDVAYTLRARNLGAAVVTNYDDTDLAFTVVQPSYHAENNNNGTDLAVRLSISSTQWDDGVLLFASSTASINRALTPDGPYGGVQLGLQISDPDGADFISRDFKPAEPNDCVTDGDCVGVKIGSTLDARFGRMHLKSGFGPELAAIPMSWQTEYWDGSSFIKNSSDHCTQLAISDVTFTGATTVVDAAADTITVTIGAVSSIFSFADPVGGSDCMSAVNIGFCDGQAGVQYGAPGAIITYPISIDLTNLAFLRFDWDQDNDYSDVALPGASINFQSYRGHDRVIYWQETFR